MNELTALLSLSTPFTTASSVTINLHDIMDWEKNKVHRVPRCAQFQSKSYEFDRSTHNYMNDQE
jgi:hypothetical protein